MLLMIGTVVTALLLSTVCLSQLHYIIRLSVIGIDDWNGGDYLTALNSLSFTATLHYKTVGSLG